MSPARLAPLTAALASLALCAPATAQFTLRIDTGMGMDDAEITHDGKYAIVRENLISSAFRVYELSSGALLGSPGCAFTISGTCQDAIAISDTRAMLLGSCAMLLDLTALPAIQVVSTHDVGLFPRDVVFTPDGTIAAVRGGTGGLYLIDSAGGAVLAQAPGQPTLPNPASYSFDVDSVVANDRYAVFLSVVGNNPTQARARVTIFDLHPAGGGAPVIALETASSGAVLDQIGAPHDVALTPDGKYAAVRSELSVALYDLSGPQPTQVWHKRLWNEPGPFQNTALDSIEVTNDRIATISLWAAGFNGTQLDVFDLAGNQYHDNLSGAPHDLTVTPSGERLVIRTGAGVHLFDLANLPAGDVLTPLATHFAPSTHASYGAGLDSVVATDTRAVTLSRVNATTDVRILDLEGDTLAERALFVMPNRPVDLDVSPDGFLVGVTGTDHALVLDLRTDALIFDSSVVPGAGFFPWCDGVALDDEHMLAFGYTGSQSGWVSLIDLFRQPQGYCSSSPNSVGPGAVLHVTGSASLAANDLQLWSTGLPSGVLGAFSYGDAQASLPFGNGVQCLGGTTHRFGLITVNASGVALTPVDYTGSAGAGGAITAGSTWNFQFTYRDTAGGGSQFNLSDAVSVDFLP